MRGKGTPLRPPRAVREADRRRSRGAGLGRIRPVPRPPLPVPAHANRRAPVNEQDGSGNAQ
uniref:Uncharacterized protein n=1 Tax=Siphoviridae sp. ctJyX12 TaxID=2827840 RepID=A0A8S5SQ01_9CAUD|nr:MAG TPA: hypothetical protein [Siphoviridae sp. ctJyX12]